jgi:hypothetical protein
MSDLHESMIEKDIGGKKSKNSGAGWLKADVFNKIYAVEGKSSLSEYFHFDVGMLRLAVREARTRNLEGALSFAWIEGDPGYPKGLEIVRYCYMIRVDKGPKGTEPIKSMLLNLGQEVQPQTYRFRVTDQRTGEWWRLLTPALARKKLGKQNARLS